MVQVGYETPQMEVIHLVSGEAISAEHGDNTQPLSNLIPN